MKHPVVDSEDNEIGHLHAWELLPWVINGRASEAERRIVEIHLHDCEQCRAEFEFQSALHAAMASDMRDDADVCSTSDVERHLEHFWQRFDEEHQPPEPAPARRSMTFTVPRARIATLAYGLAAVVLLETGGLAVLGMQLAGRDQPASYRTLSETNPAADATIRLIVDSAMPIGQLQELLTQLHLQFVGGPSETGVYSLAPSAGQADVAQQLARLRATPGVRFAEPVGRSNGAP